MAETLSPTKERHIAQAPMRLLTFIHQKTTDPKIKSYIEKLSRSLYSIQYKKYGLEVSSPKDADTRIFRKDLLKFLAQTGNDTILRKKLTKLGHQYLGYKSNLQLNPQAIESDLAPLALSTAIEDGNNEVLTLAIKHLKKANKPNERKALLAGIGSSLLTPANLNVLKLVFTDTLRTNEKLRLLENHASKKQNYSKVWSFVQDNYPKLKNQLPIGHLSYLPVSLSQACSNEKGQKLYNFFQEKSNSLPGGPRNLQIAKESVNLCAKQIINLEQGLKHLLQ